MKNFERGNLASAPGLNYADYKTSFLFSKTWPTILDLDRPQPKLARGQLYSTSCAWTLHDSCVAILGFITQSNHHTFQLKAISNISDKLYLSSEPIICKTKGFVVSREYSIFSCNRVRSSVYGWPNLPKEVNIVLYQKSSSSFLSSERGG